MEDSFKAWATERWLSASPGVKKELSTYITGTIGPQGSSQPDQIFLRAICGNFPQDQQNLLRGILALGLQESSSSVETETRNQSCDERGPVLEDEEEGSCSMVQDDHPVEEYIQVENHQEEGLIRETEELREPTSEKNKGGRPRKTTEEEDKELLATLRKRVYVPARVEKKELIQDVSRVALEFQNPSLTVMLKFLKEHLPNELEVSFRYLFFLLVISRKRPNSFFVMQQ